MILLCRNISETEQVDPVVINELHDELNHAITDSGGVQLSAIRHSSFFDPNTFQHSYDVSCIITKGDKT